MLFLSVVFSCQKTTLVTGLAQQSRILLGVVVRPDRYGRDKKTEVQYSTVQYYSATVRSERSTKNFTVQCNSNSNINIEW